MFRVPVRSRIGNGILGILGVAYFLSAIAVLTYYLSTTWGAMGMVDYAFNLALIVSAVGGLLFVLVALQNLRFSRSSALSHGDRVARSTG